MNKSRSYGWSLTLTLASLFALAPAGQAQGGQRRREEPPPPATDPPPGPVHCIGEWEESEGVLTLWRNADLIRKLQEDIHVYIPINGGSDGERWSEKSWNEWLEENEIPTDNISLVKIDVDQIYTRDFGPFMVWDGNGEIGVVDYQYGRDSASERFNKGFCDLFGINYYHSGIRHVGGNYLPNGYETSFSSTHVFEQNPKFTKEHIDGVMETFYGVENYPTLSPKTIWHHDTWGKPCSPDTIIVVDFPEDNVYKHAAADATVEFYETLESPWGRPYRILRLPMFEKERTSRWWEPEPPSVFDVPGGYGYGGGWGGGWGPPQRTPQPPAQATPASPTKPAAEGETAAAGEAEAGEERDAEGSAEASAEGEAEAQDDEEQAAAGEGDEQEGQEAEEEEEEEEEEGIVDPNWEADLSWNQERGVSYRPYMNTLVSNGRVYVPVDGSPDDEIALAVFQDGFRGYEIVGVDSGGTYSSDSLHCRTRNFFSRDPIRIYPFPPRDSEDTEEGYTVRAQVIAPNGSALLEGQPLVHWTKDGGESFEALVMEAADEPSFFQTVIPAQEHGTSISFYIEALDDGERRAVHPPVAPKGMMEFDVRRDRRAPEVSRFQPTRVASAGDWPIPVRMLATDDMATPDVRIEYSINGEDQEDIVLTREERTYWYSGALEAEAEPGDLVAYRVVAADGSRSENEATLPRFGRVYCTVAETAQVGVVDMTERSGAGAFITQALGDLEITSTYYDAWPNDWDAHDVWFVCLGVFADNHVLSAEEAADIAAALESGKGIYLEGGDTWCHDPEGENLNPLFGVKKLERGRGFEELEGEPRSIVGGMQLEYVGENLFTDRIGAVPPASLLFSSHRWDRGRTVLNHTETYRTIASTFSLAGLLDGEWPSNRKEILVRYFEFLADTDVQLRTAGSAGAGDEIPVRIEGQSGDRYILLASRAEYCADLPGYGTLRLDPAHIYHLSSGRIGRSGVARFRLEIPEDAETENVEIHVQALVGRRLEAGSAQYTNRDILRLHE